MPALGAMLSSDERRQLDAAYLADLNQANDLFVHPADALLKPGDKADADAA